VETEVQVQAATEALMAGRTTIVIAHRLSTIRDADRILVFEGGQVIEQGRHGDLVERGGAYARLNAVTVGA
jgi:ATP-binding cassette subfamily B protein